MVFLGVVLVVELTMGMLVPSLSLRLGIGVWMSAIVVVLLVWIEWWRGS